MGRRPRYRNVMDHVRAVRPDIADPVAMEARLLVVDGRIITGPRILVPTGASGVLRASRPLRGEDKLSAALEAFGVEVTGRVCLDVGASAGGFTRVLLERGATKVMAVDAGYGQLRGSLRAHSRVLNLERTNLSDLAHAVQRCWDVEVVTMDLSYLSLAAAVPQLEAVRLAGTPSWSRSSSRCSSWASLLPRRTSGCCAVPWGPRGEGSNARPLAGRGGHRLAGPRRTGRSRVGGARPPDRCTS
jgi:FtsJ-like methyltransferase